jgi:hypothetical protein
MVDACGSVIMRPGKILSLATEKIERVLFKVCKNEKKKGRREKKGRRAKMWYRDKRKEEKRREGGTERYDSRSVLSAFRQNSDCHQI